MTEAGEIEANGLDIHPLGHPVVGAGDILAPGVLEAFDYAGPYGIGDDSEVMVRSSSRVGRSDLGVNVARVEELRTRLKAAGVIR